MYLPCDVIGYGIVRLPAVTIVSINQSKPVLLFILERVRGPRIRRARGPATLRGSLPHCGVGSSRQFFTDNLQSSLSRVSLAERPQAVRSSLTHSSQVFLGWPGPLLPGMSILLKNTSIHVQLNLQQQIVLSHTIDAQQAIYRKALPSMVCLMEGTIGSKGCMAV